MKKGKSNKDESKVEPTYLLSDTYPVHTNVDIINEFWSHKTPDTERS